MLVDTYQENSAVHYSLLEIWLRILSPLIPGTGTSELIDLLKQTERAYNAIWYMYMNLPMSVDTSYQLHLVRERV